MKNVKINLNNCNNGTMLNDWDLEKVLTEENLNYLKSVSFQEDETFGVLKFYELEIVFDEVEDEFLNTLLHKLLEAGASGTITNSLTGQGIYLSELEEVDRMEKYKVWDERIYDYMEVDEEWLENVNLINCKRLEFISGDSEKLIVEYEDGKTVSYLNVNGSWGFPTTIK